jgi:hypothetical protein
MGRLKVLEIGAVLEIYVEERERLERPILMQQENICICRTDDRSRVGTVCLKLEYVKET